MPQKDAGSPTNTAAAAAAATELEEFLPVPENSAGAAVGDGYQSSMQTAAQFKGFEEEEGEEEEDQVQHIVDNGYCGDVHEDDAIIDLDGEVNCSYEMLKQVERTFINYFLRKIGPSRKTETVRDSVFSTLTQMLESKYGKFCLVR